MNKTKLIKIINSLFPYLDDDSLELLTRYADYTRNLKGTKLIVKGKRHPYLYLILKGGVKSYYYKDSKEVCLWFAFENDMVGTIRTFHGETSNETIELLEDSEFIRFKIAPIKELTNFNLAISRLITDLVTEHAVFLEERLYQLQFMSSLERYEALIKVAPEVLQKVSLTDIASYLGVSRETLSRIRGRK